MERKKRMEYLILTAVLFASVTLLFYFAGDIQSTIPIEDEAHFRLVGSLSMGYLFTSMLSGIMLAAGFFARRSLLFRIAAAVLWFITLFTVFIGGVLGFIPYQIYNLVRILCDRPAEREADAMGEKEDAL